MSVEKKRAPVLDEDGEDTEKIVEDKDYSKESTGAKDDYQHVVDQQGNRTGKVIGPDGNVYTEQPLPEVRAPTFPPMEGGLSVHFPDINIELGDIKAPDLNITEPLFNVDIPTPLVDVNIPQPLMQIDVSEPLIDIDVPEITLPQIPEKLVEIVGPLVELPEIPEKIIDIAITEPLIEIPKFPEWPEIPEDLVSIVGPLVEIPDIELPDIPEGLVQIGDISMPDVVGGIDIDLPEVPEGVQYGAVGVGVLIGLGILLLGIGRTASAVKGIAKAVK